ncbi:2-acylglycerol O-acyltransferase 3b isoform X2 [Gouania willdenowi]|nr:diacylglycerol O-acyltransferase 2-like isoform X2 [Gouania willdenowi]
MNRSKCSEVKCGNNEKKKKKLHLFNQSRKERSTMAGDKSQLKMFLEEISVLQWVFTFLFLGVLCIMLMVYLMFTSLWPLPVLYFLWMVVDWETPERGGRGTTFVRRWKVWEHLRDYFPVKLVKTADLSPNRNYIFGCHPHGIMCAGAFSSFSTDSSNFSSLFPGVRPLLAVLAGLFRVPLLREYIMCAGLRPVSRSSLIHLLTQHGKGNAVGIVIGGAEESLSSAPGLNTVVVRRRRGFVRMALECGADLVPVYSFGENELFHQVMLSEGGVGRSLQDLFKRVMGFAPCLFVGQRFGLMPARTTVTTVVGSPITVEHRLVPSEEEVDHYHRLYMEALNKLFHQHKVSCGLSEQHQLQII